jgi:hypothetical protein
LILIPLQFSLFIAMHTIYSQTNPLIVLDSRNDIPRGMLYSINSHGPYIPRKMDGPSATSKYCQGKPTGIHAVVCKTVIRDVCHCCRVH